MRLFTNGRGMPPRRNANSLHCWTFDESGATDTLKDIVGGVNLVHSGSPAVITPASAAPGGPSVGPAARRFVRATPSYFAGGVAGADTAAMLGNVTIVGSFRLGSAFASSGFIINHGSSGESSATNVTFSLYVDGATRTLRAFWENASGTNVTAASTYALPLAEWVHFAVTRTVGATSDTVFWLWGGVATTVTGSANAASVSGTQTWHVGINEANDSAWAFEGDIECLHVYSAVLTDAQIEAAFRDMRLWAQETAIHVRVDVKDAAGTYRDLSELAGSTHIDWLDGVALDDDVDTLVRSVTASVWREVDGLSLAKLVDNRLNNPLGDVGPDDTAYTTNSSDLLALNRDARVRMCRLPVDHVPEANDLVTYFQGVVVKVDWGGESDVIPVTIQDPGCALMRERYEVEQEAGFGASTGTAIQTVIQDFLDYCVAPAQGFMAAAVTLNVPTSPATNFVTQHPSKGPILTVVDDLAKAIGWRCRYKHDPATQTWLLTLYQPERTRTFASHIVEEEDIQSVSSIALSQADIRNVTRVAYASTETTDPTGSKPSLPSGYVYEDDEWYGPPDPSVENPRTPAYVVVKNTASVTLYGRSACEITEGTSSPLDTIVHASDLALRVTQDLCEPLAESSPTLFPFPEIEEGDIVTFKAAPAGVVGRRLHSDDLLLAAFSTSLALGATDALGLQLRGKPAGGYEEWHTRLAAQGVAPASPSSGSEMATGLARKETIGVAARILEASTFLRDARGSLVPNRNFQSHLLGSGSAPDGWEVTGGVMVTDVALATTPYLSAGRSLHLITNTGVVKTRGFFHAQASQLFTVEANAYGHASAPTPVVSIEWYTGASPPVLISTTAALTFTSLGAAWSLKRNVVTAPSTTAFARVKLSRSGTGDAYFDSIDVNTCKPGFHAYLDADQTGITTKTLTRVDFNRESFDYGGDFDADTNYRWTAPEDGFYDVAAQVTFEPASTVIAAAYVDIRTTAGTSYAISSTTSSLAAGWNNGQCSANVALPHIWITAGTFLEVHAYADDSSGSPAPVFKLGAGLTWFCVKQNSQE